MPMSDTPHAALVAEVTEALAAEDTVSTYVRELIARLVAALGEAEAACRQEGALHVRLEHKLLARLVAAEATEREELDAEILRLTNRCHEQAAEAALLREALEPFAQLETMTGVGRPIHVSARLKKLSTLIESARAILTPGGTHV